MSNSNKIFSLLLSSLLIAFICYLTFFVNEKYKRDVPGYLEIEGNNLLSENDYLTFVKLESSLNFKDYPESLIKDRFEKHPYVRQADVAFNGRNRINVKTNEKKIKAIIVVNSEPYLVSDNYQLLPLITNINSLDVPVITNLKPDDNIKMLSHLKTENMVQAFRILDALSGLRNKEIIKNLSEINLNWTYGIAYPEDIVLVFSGFKPAVIFGRGEEAKKVVCLETVWENIRNGNIVMNNSDYVDLRYSNDIYFGKMNNAGSIQ